MAISTTPTIRTSAIVGIALVCTVGFVLAPPTATAYNPDRCNLDACLQCEGEECCRKLECQHCFLNDLPPGHICRICPSCLEARGVKLCSDHRQGPPDAPCDKPCKCGPNCDKYDRACCPCMGPKCGRAILEPCGAQGCALVPCGQPERVGTAFCRTVPAEDDDGNPIELPRPYPLLQGFDERYYCAVSPQGGPFCPRDQLGRNVFFEPFDGGAYAIVPKEPKSGCKIDHSTCNNVAPPWADYRIGCPAPCQPDGDDDDDPGNNDDDDDDTGDDDDDDNTGDDDDEDSGDDEDDDGDDDNGDDDDDDGDDSDDEDDGDDDGDPTATPTATATGTATATVTRTPSRTPTYTPIKTPTRTATPRPTATRTSIPTATRTPGPTATRTTAPTATRTTAPTPTRTSGPSPTRTPVPTATRTSGPTATRTQIPTPTRTRAPTTSARPVGSPVSVYASPAPFL